MQPKKGKIESIYNLIDPFAFHGWFVLIELANCLNLVETYQRECSVIIECGLTWASTRPSRAGVVRQELALSEARHLESDRGNGAELLSRDHHNLGAADRGHWPGTCPILIT